MTELPNTFLGIALVPNPYLAGTGRAVTHDGRTLEVPPAWLDLMKDAKTDAERQALMDSLKVLNLGPKQHDAQWHIDTLEINMAKLSRMLPPQPPKRENEW